MVFSVSMLIFALLIPITMIGFGRFFMKNPPRDINALFGYRTRRSSMNNHTWDYAHRRAGKFWFIAGLVTLVPSVAAMLTVLSADKDTVGNMSLLVTTAQLIPMLAVLPYTEHGLKNSFDEYGRRKF